uniref:Reverse transcriptase domain-containing protein n=1 Tax=Tanacetum cinerariifolium TaxID=118510 RepID=A0A699H6U7_TANCI|nr:reverse transcriptase domain-containing protein [Tanacetum cinerariifolium]
MSTNEQTPLSQPTSVVKNTLGREQAPQNLVRSIPDEDLREYCDKNYHKILPIIAEKLHQEKVQQEKLKAVKARLNFEEASQYSESKTPNRRRNLKERLGPKGARTRSISPEQRRGRSKSPKEKCPERRTVKIRERTEAGSESKGSTGGHWKSKLKKKKSSMEDDISQPWVCKEMDPFTPRIYYFDFLKTRMPSHIKTYDGSKDLEDHLKIFQAAAKIEPWAMPTWFHVFNSTLTKNARVWFDDLSKESIDSYDDLRKAFLENYLQRKKCIKDPVEIHNIKQRNGESTEEFVRRYMLECRDVKGATECMKISGFMHGITNPELIKRLHDKIPKLMDEMMRVTVTFLRGEMAASNRERKKSKQDRFTLLTKTPREILALDKGKFKLPLPMTTPVEKRNASKFCEFHGEVGVKAKPQKRSGKDNKEKRNLGKRQIDGNINGEEDGTKGPMIIEAEIGGHCVHHIYVDGGSSSKILYEHCFNKFHPEIKNQLIPANTPLVGFSGEIIWPLGQISLLIRIGDEEHLTSARMNFMVVRSPSPYNGIIGRLGNRKYCGLSPTKSKKKNPCDMTGVPRHIAEHRLNVHEGCLLIRQKKRGQALERNKAISKEVKKLVEADIMKEVHYHSWLSNPVMVKKHDDSWRMCVDFKDLNKTCLKDGYPLREIDWKVESLCGYPCKCFMDAYKGYHPIKMAEEDEEKTVFITSQGIFCYSKMPFGLKNAIATYQRLVDKPFQKQIGRNLEGRHLLRIQSGCGPPNKVKAVIDLPSPKCLKDVQKLNGKLASLNRFLSKSAEKSLPFFKTLKKCTKKSDFQWNPKAEEAFKEIKQSIAELPMLTAPKEKEELIIYLAAAKEAVSAVLMTERDVKQVPIYFISRALQGPEINYTPMEKLILALVSAITGRLLKWRFKLGEHDIQYRPRMSVKGQILANFIVERPEDGTPDRPMEDREELSDPWILFTDGSSCVDGSGAGLIIMNPEGREFTYALRGENKKADALSKIASTSFAYLSKQVLVEELKEKAIDEKEILVVVEEKGHTWMTPVYEYLTEGVLPEEKKKARIVRRKAGRYTVINEVLYEKSFIGPWLQCVGPLQANYVLREINEGSCSMHAGPRSMVAKALSNGETPFSLTYGTKAVIPAKVGMPTLRTVEVDIAQNNEAFGISLDLLEEKREQAIIQEARNKAKMEGYYNTRVQNTNFCPEDFVYRNNEASHAEDGGKLGPKWEGLYEVTEALGKGAYKLKDHNGHILPQTWNFCNLKKCYIHEM